MRTHCDISDHQEERREDMGTGQEDDYDDLIWLVVLLFVLFIIVHHMP